MSDLEEVYGRHTAEGEDHPLLRLLAAQEKRADFKEARLEVRRPRSTLGFDPAILYLHFFDKNGQPLSYQTEPWDPDLNRRLVQRGVRAVDGANEVTRFGLALGAAFGKPETRFGDGFFSAVLMASITGGPLKDKDAIAAMLPYIPVNRPYTNGHGYGDCSAMVQNALQDLWYELRQNLKYQPEEADRIFVGAVAYYLDERFTITDRRKLNWL